MTPLRRVLVVLLLLWAVGCGNQGGRVTQTSLPPDLRADYETFTRNCGKCHSLARALNAPIRDVKQWDVYVAKMMRTPGSGISGREAPGILRFLYYHTRQRNQRREERERASVEPSTPVQEEKP